MTTIALPERKILVPRLEFPAWLRHGRARALNMLAPLGGMLTPLGASGSVAANPLASVPWIAQWKFNNDGNDFIGTNHLTNNNSATFTTGKLGGATGATQLVRASNQYWSVASNSTLQTGDVDFFVCAWVYLDTKPIFATIASKWSGVSSEKEWQLIYTGGGTDRFNFQWRDTSGVNANTFGAPALATWYFVAAWKNSSDGKAYISVNGGAADSYTSSGGNSASGDVRVGTLLSSLFSFDGRIDNVCLAKGSGAVVTAEQLAALYNGGAGTETIT